MNTDQQQQQQQHGVVLEGSQLWLNGTALAITTLPCLIVLNSSV